MSDSTEPNASLNEPFPAVTSDEYDGRPFTHEDNEENVIAYVGVDPIYQNYANEGEKPYPFTEDELVAAAERGGLQADEALVDNDEEDDDVDSDEEDDDEGDDESKEDAKSSDKATAPAPPSVPTQRKAPATRAAAKDTKSSDDEKK